MRKGALSSTLQIAFILLIKLRFAVINTDRLKKDSQEKDSC